MYTSDNRPLFPMDKRELAFFITLGGFLASFAVEGMNNPILELAAEQVLEYVDAGFEALEKQPEPPKP